MNLRIKELRKLDEEGCDETFSISNDGISMTNDSYDMREILKTPKKKN